MNKKGVRMLDGLVDVGSISFLLVFLEGLLSFFSPCVIPLIPVYMAYLCGHEEEIVVNGVVKSGFRRKTVFLHTLMFVLGISFSFFILGMSFTALGTFFSHNRGLFTRVGGILIIVLGLFQLGVFEFSFLQKTKKFQIDFYKKSMNPLVALLMGFTFSFAWTPCVGPALSSVLILASSAKDSTIGYVLVLLYTLGFVLPFLILGLFTTKALEFIQKKKKVIKYTAKIGGIILILMGIMTFTGWMNGVSKYLNTFVISEESKDRVDTYEVTGENPGDVTGEYSSEVAGESSRDVAADDFSDEASKESIGEKDSKEESASDKTIIPIYDFTLEDQYGKVHTLSEYHGKVVFLNFWATWCPPCRKEMPDIEELYQEYNLNQEEVVILGVANPSSTEYPKNSDVSKEEITAFLEENGYTFPVLFDTTGEIFAQYYISSLPTTFMIDKNSNIYGYVPNMLTKDIMEHIIKDTLSIPAVEE